jgi:4-diphosphocytidyl-2C-methyl-D-erythritol kinase
MSGMTTAIALASLGVAAIGTGVATYNGIQQNDAQKQGLKNQTTATQTAEANALSTERKNELVTNAANQKTPDISDILARAAQASKTGVGSTMLTGSGGVSPTSLNLGKTSLLGS